MQLRYVSVALAAAAASLVIGATPALAGGAPAGCSFDQSTGVLTCVTTTTTTATLGPYTVGDLTAPSGSGYVPASTMIGPGPFTGQQFCQLATNDPNQTFTYFAMQGILLIETLTTTTTTQQHGEHGKVFATSASTSASLTGFTAEPVPTSGYACGWS